MLLFRRRAIRGPAQAGSAAIGSCLCLDRRTVFEDQDWRLEADLHGAGESGHGLDDWRQIEPPPTGEAKAKLLTEERDAETVQMRTIVCGAGNLVRETLEQSMLAYARELGVDCKLVEHPHLLTTQVALTVTGPRRKLDEFRQALEAEGWATIRGDWNVLNPL